MENESLGSGATTITASELFGESQSDNPASGNQTQDETTNETSEAHDNKDDAAKKTKKESEEDEGKESEEDEKETESEDEGESEESEDDDDELRRPKKKGRLQKRLKKLTERAKEAQRERDYWREQALKAQSQGQNQNAQNEPTKEPAKVNASEKPRPDDFESHEEYVEALTDWKLEKRISELEAKSRQSQAQTEHEKLVNAHLQRVEDFKKSHEDFDEVIEDVADMRLSLTVQEVILKSENGPELMYELAKDPDELERINKLPAIQAARELGKFEARIIKSSGSTKEKPKEVKFSKAPPPPNPVGSKSEGKKRVDDPNISTLDFFRLREEQEKRMRENFF